MTHWKTLFVTLCALAALALAACRPATPISPGPTQAETPCPTEAPKEGISGSAVGPTVAPTEGPTPTPDVEKFTQENCTSSVTVELPWQGAARTIVKKDFDLAIKPGDKVNSSKFIRPVIHLIVMDENAKPVHDFNPAMKLTIQYTEDDARQAGGADKLVVVIYDHDKKEWEDLKSELNTKDMTLTVSIEHWTSHIGFR